MFKNADYLSAVLRMEEKKIITAEKFDAAAGMSYADAVKIIKEYGFGGDEKNPEKMIAYETEKFKDFLFEYSPSDKYTKFCLLPLDYHNAEACLRARYTNVKEENMTANAGLFGIDEINGYIDGEKPVSDKALKPLTPCLREGIDEAKILFESGKATGVGINVIFTRKLYEEKLKLAKINADLLDIVKTEIDCKNLSGAIRGRSENYLKEAFINGGYLGFEKVVLLCQGKQIENAGKYGEWLKTANLSGLLINFEKEADGYALNKLAANKYSCEGFTEFMLVTFYMQNEIKNVRVLTVGLAGGLDKAEIKSRMRANYAG